MKKYLLYILYLYLPCFTLLGRFLAIFVPLDRKLWVFGSWYGERYEDNARYLFEYVRENHPEIRAVWLTGRRSVLEHVRSLGHEAHLKHSLMGYLTTLKAGACVITHIPCAIWCDVNRFAMTGRSRIVQLYHGIHMKKFEVSPDKGALKKTLFERIFPEYNDYALVIATSEETKRVFSSIFSVAPERVAVTGYPRTDAIYKSRNVRRDGGMRTILFAPTWRSSVQREHDLIEGYGFDLEKLSRFLSQENAQLLIRLHPNQSKTLSEGFIRGIEGSGNIHFNHDEGIYEAMAGIDIMISDYSSIYLDYLFLDRPVIFASFDLEDFQHYKGFYYDYNEVTPGPKAMNWDEVMAAIKESLDDPGKYHDDRTRVRELFYAHYDGGNSRRVYEEISELLKKD